MLEFCSISCLW